MSEFGVSRSGNRAVIEIPKRLDTSNRTQLKETVLKLVSDGVLSIILDFSNTEFVDCNGLAVLVSIRQMMEDEGGGMELQGVQGSARELFTWTRTEGYFGLTAG